MEMEPLPEINQDILCSEIACGEYECPDTTYCEFGIAPDICDCCNICAKGLDDHCGGMLNLAGICGEGYFCLPHPKYSQLPGLCKSVTSK